MKKFAITLVTLLVLNGCAKSTTQDDFECKADDGVAPCLTTQEVDVIGPIPKSSTGNASAESVVNLEPNSPYIPDSIEETKSIEITDDRTYPIKPMINEPMRQFGSTERMWFAAWEDKKNDLYIDQQYVYWTEKGRWSLLQE